MLEREREKRVVARTYKVKTECMSADDVLGDHVVEDGGILIRSCFILRIAQSQDTSGPNGGVSQAHLLVLNLVAIDVDSVIKVVTHDIATIKIRDVEATFVYYLERRALIRIDYRGKVQSAWF